MSKILLKTRFVFEDPVGFSLSKLTLHEKRVTMESKHGSRFNLVCLVQGSPPPEHRYYFWIYKVTGVDK